MNKPIVLNQENFNREQLEKLRENNPEESDFYERQLRELFEINHPAEVDDEALMSQYFAEKGVGDDKGSWVYYPWSNKLLHIVNETDYFSLRTDRNQLLITPDEQSRLSAAVVGVAGMSVGSGIAIGCAYSGISNSIRISDADVIDTTNLNRVEVGVQDLYQKKTALAARRIYEANPYANVSEYGDGITEENIQRFFESPSKLDVVVDEIDDFKMKVLLRAKAQEVKVPLLMMTSIGDNMLIDVERYDTDSSTKPFLGKADEAVSRILANSEVSREDMVRYSIDLVERKHVPKRAIESLHQIGKTLSGRPQLYSTVATSGGVASMVIRELILEENFPTSGRYFVDLKQITR